MDAPDGRAVGLAHHIRLLLLLEGPGRPRPATCGGRRVAYWVMRGRTVQDARVGVHLRLLPPLATGTTSHHGHRPPQTPSVHPAERGLGQHVPTLASWPWRVWCGVGAGQATAGLERGAAAAPIAVSGRLGHCRGGPGHLVPPRRPGLRRPNLGPGDCGEVTQHTAHGWGLRPCSVPMPWDARSAQHSERGDHGAPVPLIAPVG